MKVRGSSLSATNSQPSAGLPTALGNTAKCNAALRRAGRAQRQRPGRHRRTPRRAAQCRLAARPRHSGHQETQPFYKQRVSLLCVLVCFAAEAERARKIVVDMLALLYEKEMLPFQVRVRARVG